MLKPRHAGLGRFGVLVIVSILFLVIHSLLRRGLLVSSGALADGVTTAVPGGSVTYTIVASNAGPTAANPVSVTDTFPAACTSVSYTSVAAGGATGNTVGPAAGNISDLALNMPAGSSVTYTATCTISPAAVGTLVNTATISSATPDPNGNNNSATDTDTLGASADLQMSKVVAAAATHHRQHVTFK